MEFTVWAIEHDMDEDVFDSMKDEDDFELVAHGSFPDYVSALTVAEKLHEATGNIIQIERDDVVVWVSDEGPTEALYS